MRRLPSDMRWSRGISESVQRLPGHNGGVVVPHDQHQVLQRLQLAPVDRRFLLSLVVDVGQVVRTWLIEKYISKILIITSPLFPPVTPPYTHQEVGLVEGVMPVLSGCHEVLDPRLVSAQRYQPGSRWQSDSCPPKRLLFASLTIDAKTQGQDYLRTSSQSSWEPVVSLHSGTPNTPWCGEPKVTMVLVVKERRPIDHRIKSYSNYTWNTFLKLLSVTIITITTQKQMWQMCVVLL